MKSHRGSSSLSMKQADDPVEWGCDSCRSHSPIARLQFNNKSTVLFSTGGTTKHTPALMENNQITTNLNVFHSSPRSYELFDIYIRGWVVGWMDEDDQQHCDE